MKCGVSGRNSNTQEQRKAKDDWRTPAGLWNILNNQYKFTTDCAASEENHLTDHWFGLDGEHGVVDVLVPKVAWINPPFSNPKMIYKNWLRYLRRVGIYRCDNLETKVWQDLILPNIDWVHFPSGRINYEGHDGKGAMFPSCLMGSGVPPPIGIEGRTLLCCDICRKFSEK
jgi:hypothetical protein